MGHMKLKNNQKKSKKLFLIIILIYVTFSYTFYNTMKNNQEITNEKFITFLIDNGNLSFENNYKLTKIINTSVNFLLKIDFTKPASLFNSSVIGYEKEENYFEELKKVSSYMNDPYSEEEVIDPIIYLYNSHQLENYNNDSLKIYGITPNVLMVSYLLKEKLNRMNIPTIVEDTNISNFLKVNGWDYSSSYKASRLFMLDKKNTYPTIKYFIDIHRDSVTKKQSTINIHGKNYAQILFVVGLDHDNYKENLNLSVKLNNLFDKYYQGLSKGILKKTGSGVDGIYNQDISNGVILIEVGGVDNTTEEILNTVNAISDILTKFLGDNHV